MCARWLIVGGAITSVRSSRTRWGLVQSLDKQVAGVAHEAVQDWPYDLVDGCGGDKVSCNTRSNVDVVNFVHSPQRPIWQTKQRTKFRKRLRQLTCMLTELPPVCTSARTWEGQIWASPETCTRRNSDRTERSWSETQCLCSRFRRRERERMPNRQL